MITHVNVPYLDVVILIQREAVVDPLWDNDQVPLVAQNPDPSVLKVPHVKVACRRRDTTPTSAKRAKNRNLTDKSWFQLCDRNAQWTGAFGGNAMKLSSI